MPNVLHNKHKISHIHAYYTTSILPQFAYVHAKNYHKNILNVLHLEILFSIIMQYVNFHFDAINFQLGHFKHLAIEVKIL